MKLNYNCIRDILLAVEVLHSLDSKLDLNIYYRYEQLQDYSIDDIQFNSQVLMENEFISGLIFETTNISEAIFITDLEKKVKFYWTLFVTMWSLMVLNILLKRLVQFLYRLFNH